MTVDRGGLDYTIKVRDEFARPLGRFRRDVDASREAFDRLKTSLATPVSDGGVANETRKITTATEAATKASIRRRNAVRQETRQENNKTRALQQLNREARRREVQERRAVISARQNFRFQRQTASATNARAAAEERVTRILNRRLQREQALQVVKERGLQSDREVRRALGLQTDRERRLEQVQRSRARAVDRLRQSQALAANERLIQIRGEAAALDRINRARINEARNAALTRAGRGDLIGGGRGGGRPPQESVSFFRRLARQVGDADNKANRASFTFRRLFGILAAFTIARNVIAGFSALVRTLVQASAQIETIELGIASLFTAVGDVRDATGNAVTGVEALSIAQAEARRQTNLLRADALLTTATFEQLAETFQVGLAPGLQAGLDVDQVRRFAVQISQAASAIGLEQRQLAEEIRSILGGTISVRQTRIAAALGITNDDIRRAREAGTLFEFLDERFRSFSEAGVLAAETFLGLTQRVTDGFRLILQSGGVLFFEDLKDLLRDVVQGFISIDEVTGNVQPNPALVNLVRILSEGLRTAVAQARQLGEALDTDTAESFAEAISGLISVISTVASGLIEGLVKGVEDLADGFEFVRNIVEGLTGVDLFNPEALREAVAIVTEFATVAFGIVTILGTWRIALAAVALILGPIQLLFRGVLLTARALLVTTRVLGATLALITSPVGLILLAVAAIGAGVGILVNETRKWFSEVLGIEVKLLTLVKIIQNSLTGVFTRLILRVDFGFQQLLQGARVTFFRLRNFIINTSTAIVEQLLKVAALVSDTAEQALADLREQRAKDRREQDKEIEREERKLQLLQDQLKTALELQEQQEFEDFERIVDENAEVPTVNEFLKQLTDDARSSLGEFFEESFGDFVDLGLSEFDDGIGNAVDVAEDGFGEIQGFIAATSRALRQLTQEIEKIDQQLLKLAAAGEAGEAIPDGLSGVAQQIGRETTKSITDFLNLTRQLGTEEQQLIDSLARQRAEINANQELSDERRQTALAQIVILESQITALQSEREASRERLLARAAARISTLTEEANFNQLIEQRELRIEAAFARRIFSATQVGDLARLRVLEAERELALTNQQAANEEEAFNRNIEFLRRTLTEQQQLLEAVNARIAAEGETDVLLTQQTFAQQAIANLTTQIELLQTRRDLEGEITEQKRLQLEREQAIAAAAEKAPVQAGIAVAAWERLTQLQDVFSQTQKIIGNAIDSFSQTMASLIVDIFDPGKDVSIKERFARFLQGIATQILTTLISLAVTAIILNAASGGILAGLFAPLSALGGFGAAEGGPIDDNAKRKARAHPAHYQRARGRNKGGGGPSARPKNLHPSDTIPIWVAQNEWVIRAGSVAKAGHDAMARINSGMFEPGALRQALGLEGPSKVAVSMATKGPGMVTGGRVREASTESGSQGSTGGVGVAIIAPTEEASRRLFSGSGRAALLDAIGDDADEIRARLNL